MPGPAVEPGAARVVYRGPGRRSIAALVDPDPRATQARVVDITGVEGQ